MAVPYGYVWSKDVDPNAKWDPVKRTVTVNGEVYHPGEYYLEDGKSYILPLEYKNRYKNPQKLDNMQHDPSKMKTTHAKQEYTVLIRKKHYYAINQKNNERYIKIFQLNNFISLRTNHNVYGKPATASVQLRGGTRVVVADKDQVSENSWTTFETILQGWNNIDNDKYGEYNGVKYDDLMQVREKKYGWAYAEKCDFEPMDEIYIFAKSNIQKHQSGEYKFNQIFFGYVSAVTKSYQTQQGPVISIEADDHLKLLQISRIANRPPMDMAVGGTSFRFDGAGNFIVEDDPMQNGIDMSSQNADGTFNPATSISAYTYTNLFAGKTVSDIIKRCAVEAGVPLKYLSSRVEDIKRIPYLPQKRDNIGDLFTGDFKDRLSQCAEAANKLNLEFFADEQGNIVLKIPSYNVGINRKPANNPIGANTSYADYTDNSVPVIYPHQIVSFTFRDSDREIFTAAQVTAEQPLIQQTISATPIGYTRSVADFDLIRKFGFRLYPSSGTPIVGDAEGAAIYAGLLIIKSLSNRYTGSITIIEESSIRVGDPIRFHLYDENPFSELEVMKAGNDESYAQAVFYVDGIDRSISTNNVSYMTLSLRAGRMKGQPSIYRQATELYRYFYEAPKEDLSLAKGTAKDKGPGQEPETVPIQTTPAKQNYDSHTVKKGENLTLIAKKYYGNGALYKKIYDANKESAGGPLKSADRIYPGQVLKIPKL